MAPRRSLRILRVEIIFLLALFVFSWIIMWKTFRLAGGNMQIATKAWSDFAATIPLIRSFSYGNNFPPQYPLFAGPPIRYHFVFYAAVGLLEKVGIPLDWALNTLSTLGFFFLLSLIYLLGKTVFRSKSVGLLSVILFLFNGSFGFLEFFKKHPISISTFSDIIQNSAFSSFGPYDGKIVSAFWSLNIFTNQRHLGLAYASFLFLILTIYIASQRKEKFTFKKAILLGIFIGAFPFVHLAVFGMMAITLLICLLLYKKLRAKLLTIGIVAFVLAVPQVLYMGRSQVESPFLNPGYLVQNLSFGNFIKYWWLNLGLTSLLAPIGLILAKKNQRKIFLPFLILFVIGNLFQFSPEIAANHKFFNLFVIGANMYVAYVLVMFWKKKISGKMTSGVLLLFLTLTGIIDLFPILNDSYVTIKDIPNNKAAAFIKDHTPKDAVFLNGSYLFDPASIAGRKIFMGWPYFPWSAGYNTNERFNLMKSHFSPTIKSGVCNFVRHFGIDYIEVQKPSQLESIEINYLFFETHFYKLYQDPLSGYYLYETKRSCNETK